MIRYWAVAETTAKSARVLLELGDTVGDINRSYYAMFEGARAALHAVDPELVEAKSHATIIRRFGKHVVMEHGIDSALGKALNTAEEVRIASDYEGYPVDKRTAETIVANMEQFMATIGRFLSEHGE